MGQHYRTWRRQLSEIQERFDAYDNDPAHYGNGEEAYQEYKKNRKPLEDEINAHHAKMEDALKADGI